METKHTYTYEKQSTYTYEKQSSYANKHGTKKNVPNSLQKHHGDACAIYVQHTHKRARAHTHTHTHNMVPHACCGYIGVHIRLVREHIYIENTHA